MRKAIIIGIELLLLILILTLKYIYPQVIPSINTSAVFHSTSLYIIFLLLLDFAKSFVRYLYFVRGKIRWREKNNIHFGIENIASLLIGVGLVITLFGVFGIDIRTLLTSISIVAAAIAIISKEFINDFLAGIYISFSRDFEINDYVRVSDQKGKVVEIRMLKIKILNDDDDMVIIPNGKIYLNDIVNFTQRDIRLMSIDFQVDIKLIGNIEGFERELITSIDSFSEFIESNSYNLKIVEMKKDYLDLKFQYTLKKMDVDLQRKIRKKTVREVLSYISSKSTLINSNNK